ncbi:MAG TPA: ABC transporter substrate-binding protein [Jatrophihabitans sp.]|uniref:ABC transporter substrate-binding protein n=1 Tax=Jatrophihabitans sp. TaxID=1932789 RepID=UPI002F04E7F4
MSVLARVIRFTALAALLAVLAACGSSSKASDGPAAGSNRTASGSAGAVEGFRPARAGTLTVATNLPGPGFWNGAGPDTMTGGYEYGMSQYMAERLGLKLKIINTSFDALVAGNVKGFDLALSTINITPARAKIANFSDQYLSSDQGVLVRKGATVDSANARGLHWGVLQASTSLDFLTETLKPTRAPAVYQDQPSMFAALGARQIDAVLLDTVAVLAQAKQSNGQLEVVGQYRTGGVYGALVPKDSPNLAIVNRLIADMKRDGTLDQLATKYLVPEFGKNPDTVPYLQP